MLRKHIQIFFLLLMAGILSGCTTPTDSLPTDSFILHGRYVDYECSPVKNIYIVVSGPSRYASVVNTDDNGNFTARAKGERIEVYPDLSDVRYYHWIKRSFNKEEAKLLEGMTSPENPLVLYSSNTDYKHRRRTKYRYNRVLDMKGGELQLASRGISSSSSSHYSRHDDLFLRWGNVDTDGDKITIFEITMYDGGLNEVKRSDLPFKAYFPERMYKQSVRLRLNNIPGEHIKKSYYYNTHSKLRWGTLILDLVWVQENKYVLNMVFDHLRNVDEGGKYVETLVLSIPGGGAVERYRTPANIIKSPYMPPSKCGGALSYDHDGYYVNDLRIPRINKNTNTAIKKKNIKILKDAGQHNNISGSQIALDHLDNIGDIYKVLENNNTDKHLITKIFEHYKSKEITTAGSLFRKIALHPNTPENILSELIRMATIGNRYDMLISKNPNLSKKTLIDLVKNYVNWEVADNLVAHPVMDESILLLLMDRKPGLSITRERTLILGNNATARVLDKLVNNNLKNKYGRQQAISLVAWNKKSSPSTLARVYKYNLSRKRPVYEIWHNLSYNPSTPTRVLNELSKIKDIHIATGVFCNKNSTKIIKKKLLNKDRLDCLPYGLHQLMVP